VNIFSGQELFGLSSTALSYIAGVLTHGKSLMAFTNPTTNSYRRLTPGFEAPTTAVFGLGNRTAAVRIPAYVKDPSKVRIEFRTIDATTNPYLGFAAMVLAGVDGIRRGLDPVSLGYGPVEDSAEGRGEQLATSLSEACDALLKDNGYLSGVFPEALIERWTQKKLQEEREVNRVPNAWNSSCILTFDQSSPSNILFYCNLFWPEAGINTSLFCFFLVIKVLSLIRFLTFPALLECSLYYVFQHFRINDFLISVDSF